jgi:hypothetical protein
MSKPFVVGQTYKTKGGKDVTIIQCPSVHEFCSPNNTRYPQYALVCGDDGWHRYNRPKDRGRCRDSAPDMSDPDNLIPEE